MLTFLNLHLIEANESDQPHDGAAGSQGVQSGLTMNICVKWNSSSRRRDTLKDTSKLGWTAAAVWENVEGSSNQLDSSSREHETVHNVKAIHPVCRDLSRRTKWPYRPTLPPPPWVIHPLFIKEYQFIHVSPTVPSSCSGTLSIESHVTSVLTDFIGPFTSALRVPSVPKLIISLSRPIPPLGLADRLESKTSANTPLWNHSQATAGIWLWRTFTAVIRHIWVLVIHR